MGSIPVRVMNKIPDLRIRDFFMQPVRGIEGTRPPAGGKKEPGGLFFSVRVPTARNVYCGCCRYDPYGNRTARPPIGGKQQSSGLLFSAGVPPCRNVYRGCCRHDPYEESKEHGRPQAAKKSPVGSFLVSRVAAPSVCNGPWRGRASCWPLPQQLLPVSAAGSGRRCCRSQRLGMSTGVAAAFRYDPSR